MIRHVHDPSRGEEANARDWPWYGGAAGKKPPVFFPHFLLISNDHFTKTDSGRRSGKRSKLIPFSLAGGGGAKNGIFF